MNRQQRRALAKSTDTDSAQSISEQMSLFGKLPNKCNTCDNAFDKQDREMVSTWNVVVIQETVRLFCPECIQKTKEALENERE